MFSQQPDQKNLLLAIVLSMGVLLLWQYLYAGPKLKEEQERLARAKQTTSQSVPGAAPQAGTAEVEATNRGVAWLVERVESGAWREPAPIGFYFAKLWYHERLYPMIWTVGALGKAAH